MQSCYVEDFTRRAAMPPAWTSVGDAWLDLVSLRENPDVVTADGTNLDLPSGRAVRMDVVWEEGGGLISSYYFVDGTTWFVMNCGTSGEPPEDRWLSVAESFEFLPADG